MSVKIDSSQGRVTSTSDFQVPARYEQFKDAIFKAAKKYDIPPEVLFGILKRETGGAFINGDGGHGRGPFQIDDRSHGDWLASHDAMDPYQSADYAAHLLRGNINHYGGNATDIQTLKKAVAAYNAGAGGVDRVLAQGLDPDAATTGHNYAQDVLGSAKTFQKWLGVENVKIPGDAISVDGGAIPGTSGASTESDLQTSGGGWSQTGVPDSFVFNWLNLLATLADPNASDDELDALLAKAFPKLSTKEREKLKAFFKAHPELATKIAKKVEGLPVDQQGDAVKRAMATELRKSSEVGLADKLASAGGSYSDPKKDLVALPSDSAVPQSNLSAQPHLSDEVSRNQRTLVKAPA